MACTQGRAVAAQAQVPQIVRGNLKIKKPAKQMYEKTFLHFTMCGGDYIILRKTTAKEIVQEHKPQGTLRKSLSKQPPFLPAEYNNYFS